MSTEGEERQRSEVGGLVGVGGGKSLPKDERSFVPQARALGLVEGEGVVVNFIQFTQR